MGKGDGKPQTPKGALETENKNGTIIPKIQVFLF